MLKPWWICRFLAFLVVAPLSAAAQQLAFPLTAAGDPAALAQALPGLAREVIAVYRDDDRRVYLDNLFRMR